METEIKENMQEVTNSDNKQIKQKSVKYKTFIEAVKFTLFSISAGLVQIGVFTLLNEVIGLPGDDFGFAYIIALVCSVVWNFTFNRKFTFKASNNVPIAMLKVLGFYLVFSPASYFWGNALESAGWNEYIVLGFNMIINFILEFLYCKYFVFRENKKNK